MSASSDGDEATALTFSVTPPPRVALGAYPLARGRAGPTRSSLAATRSSSTRTRDDARLRTGGDAAEGRRRAAAREPQGRLRHGRRRPGAHRARTDRRARRLLDENALASQDLSGFDAIVTGVRAYERRKDLRIYNRRLLEYAAGGGTVIVQYNKFEFNQAQYAPYPAKVEFCTA